MYISSGFEFNLFGDIEIGEIKMRQIKPALQRLHLKPHAVKEFLLC